METLWTRIYSCLFVAKLGANSEKVAEANFTESEGFKAAKKMVRESFGDDELNGFYFLKPLKTVSGMIVSYLMQSNVLGLGFHVSGFVPAFWGALVVSLVSTLLGILVRDRERDDR